MTYLKRTNQGSKQGKALTFLIVSLLALAFVVRFVFPGFYPAVFSPIASALWKSEDSVFGWMGRLASVARSKYSLVLENEGLRQEIASRDTGALLLDEVRTENASLKALMGRSSSTKDILGVVLSRPPISPYDTLIIDIGSGDGIKIGDKVYVEGSILIGDVAEVYGNTAKVSLFSTPGRQTSILIGDKNTETQATGRGGGNYTAELPVEINVAVGDTIASPQIRNHVFGVVEEIEVDSTDSLQTIRFRAPFNIHELRYVEVAPLR